MKYTQPNFIVDSSSAFLRNTAFDSSIYLKGTSHINAPATVSSGTPTALVLETNSGNNLVIKSKVLGTMAFEASTNYYGKTQVNNLITDVSTTKATIFSPIFKDKTTTTKQLEFDLSNITAGTVPKVYFPSNDVYLGNMQTSSISIGMNGNGGIIQVGQYGGYVQIPYNCTIIEWTINEGSTTPISTTTTVDVYKKSTFYPQAADTLFSTGKPTLTAQTNNSATGLSKTIASGDWITWYVTANNNAAVINLSLTIIKT